MVARNHDRGSPKSARQSKWTRTLPIAHRSDRWLVPIEVRPDVRAALAAGLTDEQRLNVGQPDADSGQQEALLYGALEVADKHLADGKIDVSELEKMLTAMLSTQLLSAAKEAAGEITKPDGQILH
jgi:hypothetical protein